MDNIRDLSQEIDLAVLESSMSRLPNKPAVSDAEIFTVAYCKSIATNANSAWLDIHKHHRDIYNAAAAFARSEAERAYVIEYMKVCIPSVPDMDDQTIFNNYITRAITYAVSIFGPQGTRTLMDLDIRAFCEGMLPTVKYFDYPSKEDPHHGFVVQQAMSNVVKSIAMSQYPTRPVAGSLHILDMFQIPETVLVCIISQTSIHALDHPMSIN